MKSPRVTYIGRLSILREGSFLAVPEQHSQSTSILFYILAAKAIMKYSTGIEHIHHLQSLATLVDEHTSLINSRGVPCR
jgi:hypothetical protein